MSVSQPGGGGVVVVDDGRRMVKRQRVRVRGRERVREDSRVQPGEECVREEKRISGVGVCTGRTVKARGVARGQQRYRGLGSENGVETTLGLSRKATTATLPALPRGTWQVLDGVLGLQWAAVGFSGLGWAGLGCWAAWAAWVGSGDPCGPSKRWGWPASASASATKAADDGTLAMVQVTDWQLGLASELAWLASSGQRARRATSQ
ncbi:hypothetical protein BD289DRAFT_449318 [Coniella lustricola]|uniref:Uncharacterized protein n=1 Tax=Coniella lustricola TaxID=2025994 RepID=A0A2T3ANA6_9PEZI|nr:hypothetical protein BD289DRAFT_449318 [Coniella lustricola]